jgi:hypothetical protein
MNIDDLTVKEIKRFGFKPLKAGKRNANGPDLTAIKNNRAYTIEIKRARVTKRGSIQVPPVEKNRIHDDMIAIVLPNERVLLGSMEDHMNLCTPKGYRTIFGALA